MAAAQVFLLAFLLGCVAAADNSVPSADLPKGREFKDMVEDKPSVDIGGYTAPPGGMPDFPDFLSGNDTSPDYDYKDYTPAEKDEMFKELDQLGLAMSTILAPAPAEEEAEEERELNDQNKSRQEFMEAMYMYLVYKNSRAPMSSMPKGFREASSDDFASGAGGGRPSSFAAAAILAAFLIAGFVA